MAQSHCEALILLSYDVGEQDKIVTFFTRDKGLMKGVAKGARKFGNRFGSSLEPMSHVKIFFHEKERKELVTITNCDLIDSFFDIQKDLNSTFAVSYFTELINAFFPSHSCDDHIFRLLLSTLKAMREGGDVSLLSAYFEAWMLKISGLLPDFTRCRKCRSEVREVSWLSPKKDGILCDRCAFQKKDSLSEKTAAFLEWARKNPPPKTELDSFPPESLSRIRRILQEILIFHMEKEPKSLRYIRNNSC